jgi:hypothetical protein
MTRIVEYRGVDEEDEGAGDGGAPVASRKMRLLAWQGQRQALKKRMVRRLLTVAQVAVELRRRGGRRWCERG